MRLPNYWPELSDKAARLLAWLYLNAHTSGPKRGQVKTTFEKMTTGNGWKWKKTTQRAIEELEEKECVEVERATNQHGQTRIRILTSAEDKNHSADQVAAEDKNDSTTNFLGSDSAEDKTYFTVANVAEDKTDTSNAAKPRETKAQLSERIAAAIGKSGSRFDDDLSRFRRVFSYIEFECEPRFLSVGFMLVLGQTYFDNRGDLPEPGIFCSRIIDRCLSEQKARKDRGADPCGFYWPPGFQVHRDKLRKRERLHARECEMAVA